MAWNEQLARLLSNAEQEGYLTPEEYDKIRILLMPAAQTQIGGEMAVAGPTPKNTPTIRNSGHRFGASSEKELVGVKTELVVVVRRALAYCPQDFCVFDGLRTPAEQKVLVRTGKSQTLNSKHLMQRDGFGHAVDLVPYTTRPVWEWERIWPIAAAMDLAATEIGVADRIRWGGAWDWTLADFGGNIDAYKNESRLYAERHPGKDFLDGPHFEWLT